MSEYIALRDLGDLVENTKKRIATEFSNEDVGLSSGFKRAFTAAISSSGNSIQIKKTTSVITTSANQQIFLPNQWFVLAAFAVDLVNEIVRYRNITEAVLETNINSYATGADNLVKKKQKAYDILKSENNSDVINRFKGDILIYLQNKGVSQEQAERDADLLIRFVSDEAWWLGGKNISRSNDFYVSPTLAVLNLVIEINEYQNHSHFVGGSFFFAFLGMSIQCPLDDHSNSITRTGVQSIIYTMNLTLRRVHRNAYPSECQTLK